jgi:hypothetical protein
LFSGNRETTAISTTAIAITVLIMELENKIVNGEKDERYE